ncbi:hypothetical protein ACROYT_G014083 [Oculina patagonica]
MCRLCRPISERVLKKRGISLSLSKCKVSTGADGKRRSISIELEDMNAYQNNVSDVQLRVNAYGGIFDNGRVLPNMYRERILDLYDEGWGQRQISKVVSRYNEANTSLRPAKSHNESRKIDQDALDYIEVQKLMKPSIYGRELQERLLLDGVVNPADIPSVSQINKVVREKLIMTRKKISVIPVESATPHNLQRIDEYLTEISNINATNLHFFDESSMIKTTGNRIYGSATLGQAAFEMQRYASNANYTLNLLHSFLGVDYYNIVDGPSNGMELLQFFDEALQLERGDGSAVLERGDCVVMDNCGFHHGHHIEPVLRNMLTDCGVRLIYQPPYSPQFNTCELCFHQIKAFLRRHQMLAMNETEVAIADAVLNISPANSFAHFKHCGYF